MRLFLCLYIYIFTASAAFAADAVKSKVEELFVWKMSDELSLSPAEEKKFTELIKTLNQKKSNFSADMQNALQSMQKSKTDSDRTQWLDKYKRALQGSNHLSEEELDKIKAMLGIKRTVQYLEIKQDMTSRLKSLLANPDATPKKTPVLPPPKIIEESP